MKKHLTLLLCLFAMRTGISAQTYKMTGQLLSWIDSTSIPVSGVIIFMFDQRTVANVDSTVTDSLGHFSLNIPDVPSPSFILYGTFNGAYFSMLYVDYATKFRKCPTYLDGRVVTATTEISKPADGKEVFSITISNSGHDVLKLSGGGTTFAATDKNKISILLKSPAGDPVSLYIFGTTSGDYKFPIETTKRAPQNGDAIFQLIPSSEAAKKEFKSAYAMGIGGILHLTVANGTCSGNFESTVSSVSNGAVSDVKYKAVGSFNNIPLQSKTH